MDISKYAALFLAESREHLSACNELLLEWERDPGATEPVGGLFRAVHTIKGMGATMGYAGVAELAHRLENLLDALRQRTGRGGSGDRSSSSSARSMRSAARSKARRRARSRGRRPRCSARWISKRPAAEPRPAGGAAARRRRAPRPASRPSTGAVRPVQVAHPAGTRSCAGRARRWWCSGRRRSGAVSGAAPAAGAARARGVRRPVRLPASRPSRPTTQIAAPLCARGRRARRSASRSDPADADGRGRSRARSGSTCAGSTR